MTRSRSSCTGKVSSPSRKAALKRRDQESRNAGTGPAMWLLLVCSTHQHCEARTSASLGERLVACARILCPRRERAQMLEAPPPSTDRVAAVARRISIQSSAGAFRRHARARSQGDFVAGTGATSRIAVKPCCSRTHALPHSHRAARLQSVDSVAPRAEAHRGGARCQGSVASTPSQSQTRRVDEQHTACA